MGSLLSAYESLLSAGELRADPEQAAAARRLDALAVQVENPPRTGLFARLTGRGVAVPRGVYMWGGVGRGKSMLMDLFFDHVAIERKRRVHFAEFMLEVHARIAAERAKQIGEPIAPVAAALAEET
ncbi:AFG1/ZapE family ATPase, partial [Sphingomonas sp.]|uniref:AFG1/ZapE family ATPase n=1 Tax=Sphingomonas sp. TaxID=28214 RepID=UPI0035AEE5ED